MTAFLDFLAAFIRIGVWAAFCLALGGTCVWFLFDGWRERRRGNPSRAPGRPGRIPPSRRLSGLPLDTRDAVALQQEHEPVEAGGQVVEGAVARVRALLCNAQQTALGSVVLTVNAGYE